MSDSEDEDLKLAIALSLKEAGLPAEQMAGKAEMDKTWEVIVLDSNSETEEKPTRSNVSGSNKEPLRELNKVDAPAMSSILGLDRAQMERERLARLQKRKAEDESQTGSTKVRKTEKSVGSAPGTVLASQKVRNSSRSISPAVQSLANVRGPARANLGAGDEPVYPNGVVKKTFIKGKPRHANDITLEEILQKNKIKLAVLSSFIWSWEWLLDKLNVAQSYLVFVVHAKEQVEKAQYKKMFDQVPRIKLVFPNMEGGISCMHSKLQMIFYEKYMRIAVPTANLTNFDWGETGVMENMVFIIDLPYLEDKSQFKHTAFSRSFLKYCKALGFEQFIFNKLETVNFSETSELGFVHSIGGHHFGEDLQSTGYPGLAKAVQDLGLQCNKVGGEVDFVASSIGSLKQDFLIALYTAAMGLDTIKSWEQRAKTKKVNDQDVWKDIKDRLRIYFPSDGTVQKSLGGPQNGGTICFQQSWFNNAMFPREVMRDCISTRDKMLMHNKVLYYRPPCVLTSKSGHKYDAWAYVGSANASESAWGKITMDRAKKQPKILVRNWECGVLIPIKAGNSFGGREREKPVELSAFEERVPVPMKVPAAQLVRPWYFGGFGG